MNWDGGMPFDAFLALWARTTRDRDLVPDGGITTELLRDLLGDGARRPGVLDAGIPPCAITAIDDLNPVMIASVSHLA